MSSSVDVEPERQSGKRGVPEALLRNPPNAIRAMADSLRECGFRVTEKIDSDRQGLYNAIRVSGREIQHSGVGLSYVVSFSSPIGSLLQKAFRGLGIELLRQVEITQSTQ